MAGEQEHRLRSLIAGNKLDQAIDDELDQWVNAQTRLHEVGAALIDVSTPVSENFGADTVKGALDAFKAVGEKVKERADDIQKVHAALSHAVTVTRAAQKAVAEMDGDQRDKPVFPPSKPGDDETDEIHNLKVYSSQMNLYNSWSTARETTAQQHADKVETAWKDAIAVMEKIPDDQQPGGGGGGGTGGGGGSTAPTVPVGPTTGPVPTSGPVYVPPTVHPTPTWHPPTHHPLPPDITEGPGFIPQPVPTQHPVPTPHPVPTGGGYEPVPHHHGGGIPDGGLDPYPGGTPYGPTGPVPSGVDPVAPVPGSAGSLSGMAVGGAAGAGILGGLGAGIRAAGAAGASGGLRAGGTLGASGRAAGSTRGALGGRGTGSGGAATGGTGRGGSRGSAGRRGSGSGTGAGSGKGKDKDKKKRKPASVELFDEDRDWIDDEGASSGVID